MSNSEYNKLKKVWYKKLKQSGFDDIERTPDYLKIWSARFAKDESVQSWQAKQAYYQMATDFLNTYEFATTRERNIWEYHANGMSCREIAKTLKRVRVKTNRMTVWHVINRLRTEMKRQYYLGFPNE